MSLNRAFTALSAIYILSLLVLPRLIGRDALNHLWNPYSLLHIPLYGVLMTLLTLALSARRSHWATSPAPHFSSLWLPGGISFLTGLLDELNQAFIPGREASGFDLLLNLVGIVLAGAALSFYRSFHKGRG
ncbi:MAG: VanZ family protein [Desulfobacterota bacterium]|nr:VanZ family protein [Thermodesulfobacteriota bacterium]